MSKPNLNHKRFIKFCIVGAMGMIPNLIVFTVFRGIDIWVINLGWLLGIFAGMINNYVLNELWTFVRPD